MSNLKKYLQKHIIFVAIMLCVIDALVLLFFKSSNSNSPTEGMLARIIMILIIGFLLWRLELYKTAGLKKQGLFQTLKLGLPFIIVAVLILFTSLKNIGDFLSAKVVFLFTINMLIVGIHEELLVRGFVLNSMLLKWKNKRNGLVFAVLGSSLIFGLMHLVNLSANNVESTLIQVLYATFIGVFFASIFIKTKNLYGLIIIHAFIDWCFYFANTCFETKVNTTKSGSISLIVGALIFALIGFFYIRKVIKNESKS
jgi:hypothetical protein